MGKSPQSGHVIGYRSMMEHRRIKDLLEAYTLDVLEPDERHAVQQHLATCTDCRRLADDLAATVDLLPLALAAASPLRPPTDLKDRVLHATQAPSLPLLAKRTEASGNKEMPEAPPRRQGHQPGDAMERPAWQTGRWRTVAAAALLVVLGLSLVWGAASARRGSGACLARARRGHFSQQQEIVLEVVDADEATRLILRSPDPDSRAYGKLFTRPDLPHVVAMAARLPIPPEGQTYHLWLTSEVAPSPACCRSTTKVLGSSPSMPITTVRSTRRRGSRCKPLEPRRRAVRPYSPGASRSASSDATSKGIQSPLSPLERKRPWNGSWRRSPQIREVADGTPAHDSWSTLDALAVDDRVDPAGVRVSSGGVGAGNAGSGTDRHLSHARGDRRLRRGVQRHPLIGGQEAPRLSKWVT